MQDHLVILKLNYLHSVLEGTKTVECRTSTMRRPPYGTVHEGDRLWLKAPSSMVLGTAMVLWTKSLQLSIPALAQKLRVRWQPKIQADNSFWIRAETKPYWTLIGIGEVRYCTPFSVKKRDGRAWVVLDEKVDWWPGPAPD